ncbi:MAG: exosortase H-associated membrane protein, partial [Casimicrobium sp.]
MKNIFAAPTTIRRFFVRAMLLMPIAFAAWYLLVPALHWPIRWFLSGMVALGVPEFLTQVTQTLSGFEFVTSLTPGAQPGQPFRPDAILSTDIDARIYTWGTALMATLTLAAWDKSRWAYL